MRSAWTAAHSRWPGFPASDGRRPRSSSRWPNRRRCGVFQVPRRAMRRASRSDSRRVLTSRRSGVAMGERFRIFITEPKDHPALERLRGLGEVRQGPENRRMEEGELADEVSGVHAVLITSRDRITGLMIERAERLRVIGKFGARPENVDWNAARARGVRIVWSPEANSDSVAEYTVLLILAHLRRLVEAVDHLRRGGWRNSFANGRELRGKTVGIVGLGNVGSRVARCLAGFGVTLLGYDPFVSGE